MTSTPAVAFLRHVLVKRGFSSGQIMVVLVTASPAFPSKKNFVQALLRYHPGITTILQKYQPPSHQLSPWQQRKGPLWAGLYRGYPCAAASSGFQQNPFTRSTRFRRNAVCKGNCLCSSFRKGNRNRCLLWNRHDRSDCFAPRQTGDRRGLNRDAVQDAIANTRRNQIQNARFYTGDAGDFCRSLAESGETADVVFLDPPRAGSDKTFLRFAYGTCAASGRLYFLQSRNSGSGSCLSCPQWISTTAYSARRHVSLHPSCGNNRIATKGNLVEILRFRRFAVVWRLTQQVINSGINILGTITGHRYGVWECKKLNRRLETALCQQCCFFLI